jgi:hypothetical protein
MFEKLLYWPALGPVIVIAVGLGVPYLQGMAIQKKTATTALAAYGYPNAVVTDKAIFAVGWRGCNYGDVARFTATTQKDGKSAELYVCASFPTGASVRTR